MNRFFISIIYTIFILSLSLVVYPQTDLNFKPDLIVAKDNSGSFTTIQQAINTVFDNNKKWLIIYVKKGVYKEKLKIEDTKTFIHLIGESNKETIITYDDCKTTAGSTALSATATISANDFIAENITFENSFDYINSNLGDKQAVAAYLGGDRQIFNNCRFLGNQDTLFLRSGRQYLKNCFIKGHLDFIFGNGTTVFDKCEIYSFINPGTSITASSTYQDTQFGLIFLNCDLTADEKLRGTRTIFLGRPWHESSVKVPIRSNAVFIHCTLGDHIHPEGWTSMKGVFPKTERLWEYKNIGPGAKKNKSRKQLSSKEAKKYSLTNIFSSFKGETDNWDPEKLIK
ncbi:MAG: hypothetical protein JXB50_12875 [Spirochaetes bacterium]|nr:hypothetical protein [Spirochaetota bacterium]